jgi:aminocarboxymuconate-semialdehyde decarboxylase
MAGIDLHTHLAPRLDGAPVGPPGLYRPELLEAHLQERSLDEAVVSVPPPFFRQELPEADAARWTRTLNDGLLAATEDRPRLSPLAYLPLEHPRVARDEYDRIRTDDRWAGVVGSAGGRSVSLADVALEPLWRALDDDARLLLLHPGSSADERLREFYLSNLLGNPVETAVAAAQLVFGDVLARRPSVRILLVHCGGCVPGLVGRWEHGVQTDRPGLRPLSEPPRVAVRRFYVDCLSHDEGVLDHAVQTFGPDKVVLGSDWPFPMGIEDPLAFVARRGEAFAARVAVGNARRALGRTTFEKDQTLP